MRRVFSRGRKYGLESPKLRAGGVFLTFNVITLDHEIIRQSHAVITSTACFDCLEKGVAVFVFLLHELFER